MAIKALSILIITTNLFSHSTLAGNGTATPKAPGTVVCKDLVRRLAEQLGISDGYRQAAGKTLATVVGNIETKVKPPSSLSTSVDRIRVFRGLLPRSSRLALLGQKLDGLQTDKLAPGDLLILNILLLEAEGELKTSPTIDGPALSRLQRFVDSLASDSRASLSIAREEINRIQRLQMAAVIRKSREAGLDLENNRESALGLLDLARHYGVPLETIQRELVSLSRDIHEARSAVSGARPLPVFSKLALVDSQHLQSILRWEIVSRFGIMEQLAPDLQEAALVRLVDLWLMDLRKDPATEPASLIDEYRTLAKNDLKDHEIIQLMETRRLAKHSTLDTLETLQDIRKATTRDRKASLGLLRLMAQDSTLQVEAWRSGFKSFQEKLGRKRLSIGDSDIVRLLQFANLDDGRMDSLVAALVEGQKLLGNTAMTSSELVSSILMALRLKGGTDTKLSPQEILLVLRSPLPDTRSFSERVFDERERVQTEDSRLRIVERSAPPGEGGLESLITDTIAATFLGYAVYYSVGGRTDEDPLRPW